MQKNKSASADVTTEPSHLIDAKIQELNDWRGATLAKVRALIRQALPDAVEAVKWRGVPGGSMRGSSARARSTRPS